MTQKCEMTADGTRQTGHGRRDTGLINQQISQEKEVRKRWEREMERPDRMTYFLFFGDLDNLQIFIGSSDPSLPPLAD